MSYRRILRVWPLWIAAAVVLWLYCPVIGQIPRRDREISRLRKEAQWADVSDKALADSLRAMVEAREGEVRILYRPLGDSAAQVLEAETDIPVEGELRLEIPEGGGLPEIHVKRRGWCFRPKAVAGFTADDGPMPGLGVRFAYFGDGGLASLALWDREDPGILPDYVGAEVDWRLRRLGMRNTAVGIGGAYDIESSEWRACGSIGLFF